MTEKRFIPVFTGYEPHRLIGAKDNGKIITFEEMFDLLNSLSEENEQLKLDNKRLLSDYTDVCNDNIALGDENEQLKQQIKDMQIRFKRKYDYEFDEIVDELDLGDVND